MVQLLFPAVTIAWFNCGIETVNF
ncbi:hypothetical protein ACL6C3_21185 [Capilliphycus salinus ALCB114379]